MFGLFIGVLVLVVGAYILKSGENQDRKEMITKRDKLLFMVGTALDEVGIKRTDFFQSYRQDCGLGEVKLISPFSNHRPVCIYTSDTYDKIIKKVDTFKAQLTQDIDQ